MKNILMQLKLIHLGFAVVFLSILTSHQLNDPDYFWHLRTGQYLLEYGSLPNSDIFSYTRAGQPWILHEWLFQLLLACIYTLSGSFGIKLMVASLATTTLVIIYATINRILGKPYIALCFVMLCYIFLSIGISPRPQLITLILLATFLRVLIGFKYFSENRGLLTLPPLMMLWVNFHGGFAIGLALLFLFTACEWLKFLALEYPDIEQRRRLQWLVMSVIVTLSFSLINPYFIQHWLYPFQAMGMEASTHLGEWYSPNFHLLEFKYYLILVFAFFIVTIYRQGKADITELAIPLFFTTMGFVAIRHIPLAAINLTIFSAVALKHRPLTQMLPVRWMHGYITWYFKVREKDKDLGGKEYVLNWLVFAALIGGSFIYYPINEANNAKKTIAHLPVKATEFIIKEDINGRLFNHYDYGGYLIYQFYPMRKVFVDGRADVYGDKFIKELIEISIGMENWAELFDKYNIDYVLIPRGLVLRQLLLARGDFKQVYEDEISSILLKNSEENADIIAKYSR